MALDPDELRRYRAQFDAWCEQMAGTETGVDLSAITSAAEMIAYTSSSMRAEGYDDETAADAVELLCVLADIDRVKLREAARILRALGYSEAIVDRLKARARAARKPTYHPSWQERMTSKANRMTSPVSQSATPLN
jgi:hypothetical protein